MTQYIVNVSSFEGLVPGASHYRGRVQGPSPGSCHGGTRMGGTKSGKTECFEGHVLPDRVEWDVEAAWSEERHRRWGAKHYEDAGPQQFGSTKEVLDRATEQFLDGSGGEDRWWETDVKPAEEGDELWYGWIDPSGGESGLNDPSDGWGMMIARKCTG